MHLLKCQILKLKYKILEIILNIKNNNKENNVINLNKKFRFKK